MASLLQLKTRIKAAQNVSKTTKAMQMIAASKLKRAQQATIAGRPYIEKLEALTTNLTTRIESKHIHPYMHEKVINGKSLVIFLAPDKGLCGGLITNLLREFMKHVQTNDNTYVVIGKKAEGYVTRLEKDVIASFQFGTTLPTFDMVYPIVKLIDEYYLSGKVDSVKILGAHFTSLFTQTPKIDTILPIKLQEEEQKSEASFYRFEPNVKDLLPSLLKHFLEMTVYQHLLESFVSEQAARMMAMQNATNNAKDIIEDLLLEYNKTRQAKITSEILDIVGSRIKQH